MGGATLQGFWSEKGRPIYQKCNRRYVKKREERKTVENIAGSKNQ